MCGKSLKLYELNDKLLNGHATIDQTVKFSWLMLYAKEEKIIKPMFQVLFWLSFQF